MKKSSTQLTVTYLIILFIILLSSISLIMYTSSQMIYNPDFLHILIRVNQLSETGYVPWEDDHMVIDAYGTDIGWTAHLTYPIGFHLLLTTVKLVTGIDSNFLVMIRVILWLLFSMLIYIFSYKLTENKMVATISLLFAATILSGGSMLGPLFPLPTSFGVISIFTLIMIMLGNYRIVPKIVLGTLILSTVLISHRASTFTYILFTLILFFIPVIIYKNRKKYFLGFILPMIVVSYLAFVIAYFVYYKNIIIIELLNKKMLLGLNMVTYQELITQINLYIPLIMLLTLPIAILILYVILRNPIKFENCKHLDTTISKKGLIISYLVFLLIILGMVYPLILNFVKMGGLSKIVGNPLDGIHIFWNTVVIQQSVLKNYLYASHWGAIPFLLLPVTLLLLFKNFKNNIYSTILFSLMISIVITERMHIIVDGIVVSRIYYFISPFYFIFASIVLFQILKRTPSKFPKYLGSIFIILVFFSIGFSVQHVFFNKPTVQDYLSSPITYVHSEKEENSLVFSQKIPAILGRYTTNDNKYVVNYRAVYSNVDLDMNTQEMEKHNAEFIMLARGIPFVYSAMDSRNLDRNTYYMKDYDNDYVRLYSIK